MALPDYLKTSVGTAKSWKASGGDYAITPTSLANGSARQGAKGDLGANRARRWAVLFTWAATSAPTNGTAVSLFWAGSPHATAATDNPGNTSGTDTALSNPTELTPQLIFLGDLILSNARGTNTQTAMFVFEPQYRYGIPVIYNGSGVAGSGTAGNFEVRLVPLEDAIEDTV